jgi:hypothetical protein
MLYQEKKRKAFGDDEDSDDDDGDGNQASDFVDEMEEERLEKDIVEEMRKVGRV